MNRNPGIRFRRRRRVLAAMAGTTMPAWFPTIGRTQGFPPVEEMVPAIRDLTKGRSVRNGRVTIDIPRIADNGNTIPCKVTVDSPMTAEDHVKVLHFFSERNPRPVMARFHLGPRAGRAELSTRVRLGGTQRFVVVAEMGDGSFWSGIAEVLVTISACIDGT
jgi:sulfur-oxidizing protein SoxY